MELTKEFVENCNQPSILRDFLLQAMERVDSMEKELASLREATRWRKYPEEKPSEDTRYIICGSSGFIDADRWVYLKEKQRMGFGFYDYGVKCWMPCPKPPEE